MNILRSFGLVLALIGTAAYAAELMTPGTDDLRTIICGALIWGGSRLVFIGSSK